MVPMTRPKPHPALPAHVAAVSLGPEDDIAGDVLSEEQALLHPRTAAARRRDFALGRAAARRALRALGSAAPPIPRGAHREPVWPEGVVGSITHAQGFAVAAVAFRARCGGVGLDLEHRTRFFPELMDQIAFGVERHRLGALPPASRPDAVLEVFAAKEAIYKAFFPRVRRFFGFEAAQVMHGDEDGRLTARLVEPLDPDYPPDRTFRVDRRWFGELVLTWLVLPPDG